AQRPPSWLGQLEHDRQAGLNYAQRLSDLGWVGPAHHLHHSLARLGPAEGADARTDPPGLLHPVLLDLAAIRDGEPAAANRLGDAIESGDVQVRATAPDPESPPEDWTYSFGLWTHNDNAAYLRDGVYRSDDGPTASLGIDVSWSRGPNHDLERWTLGLGHNLFTERGGMQRSDLAEITLRHVTRSTTGSVFFDSVTRGWLVGVQGTGDFGGAAIQDGFHELMDGTSLGGRRLGAGLQDQYTADRELALLVGGELTGHRDLGLVDLDAGVHAAVPVGPTGVGSMGTRLGARLGRETGPYASMTVGTRYQWTQGEALQFDGAPRGGFIVSPEVKFGWQFESFHIGIEWQGNRWGTQTGLGDRDAESVALRVDFSVF
ncbi:MAG: hypothetical protein AAFQ82_25695, partial [Myxococcota bacterium]